MKLHRFQEIETLKDVWLTLENQRGATIFQSFNFHATWAHTCADAQGWTLCPLLLEDASGPVLILPLCYKKKKDGWTYLQFMTNIMADYEAPVLGEDTQARLAALGGPAELFKAITSIVPEADILHLWSLPQIIHSTPNPLSALPHCREHTGAWQVTLSRNFEAFYTETISKKIRADSMRQRRRLLELNAPQQLVFTVQNSVPDKLESLDQMFRQKEAQYEATGAENHLKLEGEKDFYRTLTINDSRVHVSTLCLGDVVLATHWGIVDGQTFYYMMPSYERGLWAKFSTGRILLECLLEHACSNGVQVFDFTCGDEPYKQEWGAQRQQLYMTLAPLSLRYKAHINFYRYCRPIYHSLKRLYQSIK